MFSAAGTESPPNNSLNHENVYGLLKEFKSGLEEGQLNVPKKQCSWNPSTLPSSSHAIGRAATSHHILIILSG